MEDKTKIEGMTRGGDANGTSLMGYVTASFEDLREALGEPEEGDGYKVSTEWTLTWKGQTFTIYDYKETSLYDRSGPSVEQFRKLPAYDWHIGGRTDPEAFRRALLEGIRKLRG